MKGVEPIISSGNPQTKHAFMLGPYGFLNSWVDLAGLPPRLPVHSYDRFMQHVSIFQMSRNSLLRAVYDKCIKPIEHSIPPTLLERMATICTNRKYSTIATETDVFINSNKLNCILQKVPNAYIKGVVAFAIQKRSPYRTIFKRT
jgi:hypothetical protein